MTLTLKELTNQIKDVEEPIKPPESTFKFSESDEPYTGPAVKGGGK